MALADAAISCTVLHEARAGHADTWLLVAERAAQEQDQPELMNQLQGQKGATEACWLFAGSACMHLELPKPPAAKLIP
jgi:hypothetical protein